MMDNEAIVDQIVRSLSFEVVAVPQNTVQVDSTSKSTPLNVKIRVRKKHNAGLRHGVLSMPKVDTKTDGEKDSATQRIRLVSSDQTVMSFNMLMEADFEKVPLKHGSDANDEPKNTDKLNNSPVFSKRNKDIFGRCKPGGCLDPPYGEDKYSYQPAQQNLSLLVKDDINKLRSSSIFKNKLFKRKKKSSQEEDLIKSESKKTTEDDSILSLFDTASLQTTTAYSNSIITYPHSPNSGELSSQDEKSNRKEDKLSRKRQPSENKCRSLVIENPGSYFVVPKKSRNRSNQSDYKIVKLNEELAKSECQNISRTTTSTTEPKDNSKKLSGSADEVNCTSKISNFSPLLVLSDAIKNRRSDQSDNKIVKLTDDLAKSEFQNVFQTITLSSEPKNNSQEKESELNEVNRTSKTSNFIPLLVSSDTVGNKSNQSDYKIVELNNDLAKSEYQNMPRTTTSTTEPKDNSQDKLSSTANEVDCTSKSSNISPLLVSLDAIGNKRSIQSDHKIVELNNDLAKSEYQNMPRTTTSTTEPKDKFQDKLSGGTANEANYTSNISNFSPLLVSSEAIGNRTSNQSNYKMVEFNNDLAKCENENISRTTTSMTAPKDYSQEKLSGIDEVNCTSKISNLNPLLVSSDAIGNGSSDQSDYKIVELNDDLAKSECQNISRTITSTTQSKENSQEKISEIDKVNCTSKINNFSPLLVSSDAVVKKPVDKLETFYSSPLLENIITKNKVKTDNQIKILTESENNNLINRSNFTTPFHPEQDTTDLLSEKIPNETVFLKTDSVISEMKSLYYTDSTSNVPNTIRKSSKDVKGEIFTDDGPEALIDDIDENEDNVPERLVSQSDEMINNQLKLSLIDQNLMSVNKPSVDCIATDDCNNLDYNGEQMDSKSHPLITTKEKSILDITTNFSQKVKESSIEHMNNVIKMSENIEKFNTVSHSTDNLKHIWKNKTEPLKSMPDFITKTTLSATINELKKKDNPSESQLLTSENQEHRELQNNSLIPIRNSLEDKKEEAEIIHEVSRILEAKTKLSPSDVHFSENKKVELTNRSILENNEKIFLVNADHEDDKSPETLSNENLEKKCTSNTEPFVAPYQSNTRTKTNSNNKSPENKDDKQSISLNASIQLFKKLTSDFGSVKLGVPGNFEEKNFDTQNTVLNQQENIFDTTYNKTIFETKNAPKNTSLTKLTEVFKNKESDIVQSISEVGILSKKASNKQNDQDFKHSDRLSNSIPGKVKNADETECIFDKSKNITAQIPNPLVDSVKADLIMQYKNMDNAENQIISNENSEVLFKTLQPPPIVHEGSPWKMDMAFQSYIDENNERVIKSFDSQHISKRYPNDTILVAQYYLDATSNEFKIPIDQDIELSIQVKSNKSRTAPHKVSKENRFVTDQLYGKQKSKIVSVRNEIVSDTAVIGKDYEDVNKGEANKKKEISDDMRDALNAVYEQELLPLQDLINGLREEIDVLVVHQKKIKEKVQKLVPKRSRPLRLVHHGKKCACVRRM